MPPSFLSYAPVNAQRVMEGLPLQGSHGHDEAAHFRNFMAANALYALLDYDPTRWTDYTSDTESDWLSTDSGPSDASSTSSHSSLSALLVEDGHLPGFLRRVLHQGRHVVTTDAASMLSYQLPDVTGLCSRPSDHLWDDGVWRCPVQACGEVVDPLNLSQVHQRVVSSTAGGPSMLVQETSSARVSLERHNPWRFLRFVDALGWEHLKVAHLNPQNIELWYPDPESVYKQAPGVWWLPDWLASDAAAQVRLGVERADGQFRTRVRMWKARKALAWAKRGLHRARVHLTQQRHDAMEARETIARTMFTSGRSVPDVALALLAHMRVENTNEEQLYWRGERDYYQERRREWFVKRREWIRDIKGGN